MSAADKFLNAFKQALRGSNEVSAADAESALRQLDEAYAKEPLPTVAVVGETGVGKSTTLNALFNAGAAVGHSKPTTTTADGFEVAVYDHHGNRGDIRVLDLPGLGESIASADRLRALYRTTLPGADVILWVHPANDRMLEFTQRNIAALLAGENAHLFERVVFGLNKSDDIFPNNWKSHANVPSEEQLAHLGAAQDNFSSTLRAVFPSNIEPRVTTYSALRRYQLPKLFRLLMEAMPAHRKWVLERRMDIANFADLADPRIVHDVVGKPANPVELPAREAIMATMTKEDAYFALRNDLTPEQWWLRRFER